MKGFLATMMVGCAALISALDPTIPVLDIREYENPETKDLFLAKLDDAMHNIGFFALEGMDLDLSVLDNAYNKAFEFFKMDSDYKMTFKTESGQRGYQPGESAKDEDRWDVKEFYHTGRELEDEKGRQHVAAENVWPDENFKDKIYPLFKLLDEKALVLGKAFAEVLGQRSDYINEMISEGDNLMRTIHYPSNPPADSIWAGAHTDINFFTLLPRSTARGLQVLNKEGVWIDVVTPDNTVIVNVGDMLENISNGYCRSAYHRVVDPGLGQERYSIVFFVHPRSQDPIGPLPNMVEKTGGVRKYANATHDELLFERLIDLGIASEGVMKTFVESGVIDRLKEVNRFSEKAEKMLKKSGFLQEEAVN